MGKIPRSEPSVDFRPAMQPFSTGDGYSAPGAGLQRIGQGISSVGQGIASFQEGLEKDDLHQTRVNLLNASHDQDLEDRERMASFNVDTANIDGYAPERVGSFETRMRDVLGSAGSRRAKQFAELQIARMRGTVGERAYGFAVQQQQQKQFLDTERLITREFGLFNQDMPTDGPLPSTDAESQGGEGFYGEPAAATRPLQMDPREIARERLQKTLQIAEGMIRSYNGDSAKKQRLSEHTAALAFANITGEGKEMLYPVVEAWMKSLNGNGTAAGQGAAGVMLPDGKEGPSGIPAAQPGTPGVITAVTSQPYRAFNAQGYGERTTGQITVNGRTYEFVNGGTGRGSIPLGEYGIKRFTPGQQRAAEGFQYRQDAFELTDVRDDAPGTKGQAPRQGLLIHDGNRGVTAGCIGIKGDFKQFQADLMAEMEKNGGKFPKLQLGAPNQGGTTTAASAQPASAGGVPQNVMQAFAQIESGGDARRVTGSYKGLYQLSDEQFRKYGGKGDIFDPAENTKAAAAKFADMSARFETKNGRPPSPGELYMMHQQGEGGAAAHAANPDRPAWQSMASTAEGRQKGEAWAKRAIWGNLTPEAKKKFGSVENITSGQFTEFWNDRVAQIGGAPTPASSPGQQVAQAAPPLSPVQAALQEKLLRAAPALRERYLKTVTSMVEGVEREATRGFEMPDAIIDRTAQEVARTGDPALARRMELLSGAVRNARTARAAAPSDLKGMIQQIEAEAAHGPIDPTRIATLDFLKKQLAETTSALAKNPYDWGVRAGLLPQVPPLRPDAPPDQMQAALEARVAHKATMEVRIKQPVPLFQAGEVEAFKDWFTRFNTERPNPNAPDPIGARLAVLRTMYDATGSEYLPTIKTLFAQEAPGIATVGWLVGKNGDPQAIKTIMQGIGLTKAEGFVSRAGSETAFASAVDRITLGAFSIEPRNEQYVREAARYYYEAKAAAKKLDPTLKITDPDLVKEAVQAVTGLNSVNGIRYGGIDNVGAGYIRSGEATIVIPSVRNDGGLRTIQNALRLTDLMAINPYRQQNRQPGGFPVGPDPRLAAAAAAGRDQPEGSTVRDVPGAPFDPDAGTGGNSYEVLPNPGMQVTPSLLEYPDANGRKVRVSVVTGMPVDGKGRPASIGAIRMSTPVYAHGNSYFLRTGTDASGQPEFFKMLTPRGEMVNYALDFEALRDIVKTHVPEGTYRDLDARSDPSTLTNFLTKYRVRPTQKTGLETPAERDANETFVPRFAPIKR